MGGRATEAQQWGTWGLDIGREEAWHGWELLGGSVAEDSEFGGGWLR